MKHETVENLVAKIHASDAQLALALTGGGTLAITSLLATPGGSRTVLACAVPYSSPALAEFLGKPPDQYCSEATARAMAMVAFTRAERLGAEWTRRVGIGCTASLATDRPKQGDHRVHVACQTGAATVVTSLTLTKGRRTRAEEEQLAAAIVLNHIAAAAGVTDRLPLELVGAEALEVARHDASPEWQSLWLGRASKIAAHGSAAGEAPSIATEASAGDSQSTMIFSGAFNPRHHGHVQMALVAAELLGEAPDWELSINNVDKPPLDYLEVGRRLAQFEPAARIWLTRAATFVAKAELFPGATFLVGADTILRIDNPRYYGGSELARDAAIRSIAERGCKFLVFGRLSDPQNAGDSLRASAVAHEKSLTHLPEPQDTTSPLRDSASPREISPARSSEPQAAEFRTLAQLELSSGLKALCLETPAHKFRADVSSTALRQR